MNDWDDKCITTRMRDYCGFLVCLWRFLVFETLDECGLIPSRGDWLSAAASLLLSGM